MSRRRRRSHGRRSSAVERFVRSATLRPSTINQKARTIDAVIATGNPVLAFNLQRRAPVLEALRIEGAELPERVSMIDSHKDGSVKNVIGSVRNFRIEDGELIGTLHFAEDAEREWKLVRDGHITDVSPGYERYEVRTVRRGTSAVIAGRRYEAPRERALEVTVRWKPREVSLAVVGADEAAKVRKSTLNQRTDSMNERLRKFLESIGLRSEATEEQAQQFISLLSGRNAQIANILEMEEQNETSRFMARAGLQSLGRDPEKPWEEAMPEMARGMRRSPREPSPDALRTRQAESSAVNGGIDDGSNGGSQDLPGQGQRSAPAENRDTLIAEGRRMEQERQTAIRSLAGEDVPTNVMQRALDDPQCDESRASRMFLAAIRGGRSQPAGPSPGAAIHSRSREQDVNVRSLAAGMMIGSGLDPTEHSMFLNRGLPGPEDRLTDQDAERGHPLRGMSFPELFRECLRMDMGHYYRTLDEAFLAARSAAPSGGTLSYVFGTNVWAQLIAGWDTVADTTGGWCYEEDVANFLQQEDITFQGSARLKRLPRGDTAGHATVGDSHETYYIYRFARQWVADEQDVIDDRFNALMGMAQELGEAARRVRPDLVYSMLLNNPTMADTGAVFNSTAVTSTGGHANLGTAALGSDALISAITAMGTQRDSNSNVLNIVPTHLVVPSELQWTARELTKHQTLIKLFADSSDPLYSTINQLAEMGLTPVSDARLDATGVVDPLTGEAVTGTATNWFLFKAGRRCVRVAYRRGTGRRPQLRRFDLTQGQWGIGYDINIDIGTVFADWRGAYKSTGAGE